MSEVASQPRHDAAGPGLADPDIGAQICDRTLARRPGRAWWAGIALSVLLLAHFAASQAGLAPLDDPSPAGPLDFAAYHWCRLVASGSLLLSGILLLVEAEWRCAVIRIAQTVALAAACAAGLVAAAGGFEALPTAGSETADASVSALDVAMLATILTVSAGFWAIGLLPDLAVLRDRALDTGSDRAGLYRRLGAGWQGSARQWQIWGQAYRATALLACLVAIGVEVDFGVRLAASPVPGWRDTMLPVRLLIDAVLAGSGLVAAIVALLRGPLGLEAWIAPRHLDILARLLLVLGLVAFYCHAAGLFSTMLGGQAIEREASLRPLEGGQTWPAWSVLFGALLPVQLFWFPAARRSVAMLGLVGLLAVIGVYGDSAMIQLAAAEPGETIDAVGPVLFGALGLMLLLLLLFVRALPALAITETRALKSLGSRGAALPRQPAIEPSGPHRGIVAVFAGREGLLAAVRRIRETDAAVALNAWGPVPMPEVSAAILPPARPLRTIALRGAIVGGIGFLILALWFATRSFEPLGRASWPSLLVPTVAIASAAGALALILALFTRLLRSRHTGPFRSAGRNRRGTLRHPLDRAPARGLAAGSRASAVVAAGAAVIGRAPGGPVQIEAGKPLPQSALAYLRNPDRRMANGLVLGIAALGAARAFDETDGFAGACLAAWLCLLALPAGALPVVIMIERSDAWRPQPETALLETLRWLLSLMPVAVLLLLPVLALADAAELYPWLHGERPDTPLATLWFTRGFLALRLVGYAAAWIALARLFARRSSGPSARAGRIDDGRAVLGLGLHIFVATLAVTDLIGALDHQARSTLAGLVVMAGWSSFALAASIVAAPPDIGPSRRRLDRLTPLAVLLAIWAALHFVSYAMLAAPGHPQDEAWFAMRAGSYGRALSAYGAAVVSLAALLTLKPGENRTRLVAILALVLHGLETFWLVTPSLRGSFTITFTDSFALAGMLAFAFGLHPLSRRFLREPDDGRRSKAS